MEFRRVGETIFVKMYKDECPPTNDEVMKIMCVGPDEIKRVLWEVSSYSAPKGIRND